MSNINTSNITVPSVATLVQHLVDSNPHPQYLLGSDLLSTVNATVHLDDLADVELGASIQDRSLIVYNSGTWSNTTIAELLVSSVIPYATTATAGIVKLTAEADVDNSTDFSTVITPGTLGAWGRTRGFVSSGNFYTIMSQVFAGSTASCPVDLNKLSNFVWTSSATVGQVLTLSEYDPLTNSAKWTNSSVVHSSAIADTAAAAGNFGIVKIASEDEIISGTNLSFSNMQSSGHLVPSLASLDSLMGQRFVSRISSTSDGSSTQVYSSIVGHSTSQGITGSGIMTVINNNGLVIDHIVSGSILGATAGAGELVVQAGSVVSAVVGGAKTGEVYANGIVDIISTGIGYNLTLDRLSVLNVGAASSGSGNGKAVDVRMTGVYIDSGEWIGGTDAIPFNTVNVTSNGMISQIENGTRLAESDASAINTSGLKQGIINVSTNGVVEYVHANALTKLTVDSEGKVYHAVLSGLSANLTVKSAGYVEDCKVYSGANILVSSGGVINGLTIYESANVIVQPTGKILGMVKYAPCSISSGKTSTESAYIQRVQLVKEDMLVYSNASSTNISSSAESGAVVFFSASAYPVGLRRESSGAAGLVHSFYPMTATTRIPNTYDSDLNDYTINVSSLSVWEDLTNDAVTWYVTF